MSASCGGCGFGFDILPVDPDYQDERGGWVSDDGDDSDDFNEDRWPFTDLEEPGDQTDQGEDEPLPW